MYKSTGKLVFDPKTLEKKCPFWLILKCDNEIIKYYRSLMYKERCLKLSPLAYWGAHVSIIRGEKPNNGFWTKLNGEEIEFEYDGIIREERNHFWIDVDCKRLVEVRKYYGLSDKPYYDFHMTIGKSIG
jgi:hypothetical protein